MPDVIPLSRFMYDLRTLCMSADFVKLNDSAELVETCVDKIKIRVRNLVGLCETVIRYDELRGYPKSDLALSVCRVYVSRVPQQRSARTWLVAQCRGHGRRIRPI